jgi:hypothetical protein
MGKTAEEYREVGARYGCGKVSEEAAETRRVG